MLRIRWALASIAAGLLSAAAVLAQGQNSMVVAFTDGHQQTFSTAEVSSIEFKGTNLVVMRAGRTQSIPMNEIARIEFDTGVSSMGRGRFVGKWRVGDGAGNHFTITLDRDGRATRSLHTARGTWSVVNGEARITWEDDWHDMIRKVGSKYEKVAFGPGKTFSDQPDNVADAKSTSTEPL